MVHFSVITFNLQFGQIWDKKNPDAAPQDLDRAIAAIRNEAADIILLQEVEQVQPELGQVEPPPNFTRLQAAFPDYHAVFSYPPHNPRELPFGYGLAILSRTPLTDVEQVPLPAPDLTFEFMGETTGPTDRLLLAARTSLQGRDLQLFNTHLQAFFIINYSSDDFTGQRDVIASRLRESNLPTILGGDMNAAPGESIVPQFEAEGYRTVQKQRVTWRRMPYVLDHLFYNQPLRMDRYAVVDTDAADHSIIRAEFVLP